MGLVAPATVTLGGYRAAWWVALALAVVALSYRVLLS
jgi:hypothetical protein